MELRLYVAADPLIFVEPLTAPYDAPNARRWLIAVSNLSMAARSGVFKLAGALENSSVTVEIDNRGRQAASLLGVPLRVCADVYDGLALYYSGVVQAVRYGTTMTLEIEG